MTELAHKITLTTGDWSSDGHGITSSHVFTTNFSASDIEGLHDAANRLHGLEFDTQCEEYEDSSLTEEFIEQALVSFTNQEDALRLIKEAQKYEYISAAAFAELYLYIARLVEPTLRWELSGGDEITIGGYGLHSN